MSPIEAWPWSGTTVGQATSAPYTDKWFRDFFQLFMVYDRRYEVVADTGDLRYAGGLQVQNNVGANIRVLTGVGMVNGNMFRNTTNLDLGAPDDTPSIRTDLVAVQTNVTAAPQQTVDIVILKGTDGNNTPPTLTQNDAVRWEVALAEVDITPGPVIAAIRFVGRAIRTPLGPGYQIATLAADDVGPFTAAATNSIGVAGVMLTLGPGKWLVWGTLGAQTDGTAGVPSIFLSNNTLAAIISSGRAEAGAAVTYINVTTPPVVIDAGVITEIELLYYASGVNDTVLGDLLTTGERTGLTAMRVV